MLRPSGTTLLLSQFRESTEFLREKVQESVFVTELASVQVALKIEEFHTLSKDSVVCGLLQNRPDSPKVSLTPRVS